MSATKTSSDWAQATCVPCEGGTPAMGEEEIRAHLEALDGWSYDEGRLVKTYRFKNYFQTMSFVNALAWIAHQQDHHPELVVGYRTCEVRYSTHAVGGISDNDFICAAKVDGLL